MRRCSYLHTSGFFSMAAPSHRSPQQSSDPLLPSRDHQRISHWLLLPLFNPQSSRKNMKSALQHAEVIDDYLAKEAQERRVAGPFTRSVVPNAHVSRFGAIPKAHQPNKWRLIVDLSHPKGASVNDGIPKHLCSMSYITVDDAISRIITLGRGTLLAKIDIQSAFRLIPVHTADRHLLTMEWKGAVYFDTCLPFGLRSAPKLFNMLADLLQWILLNQGVSLLIHYLDDYLTMGPPSSPECHRNLSLLIEVCAMLGIPLALGKVEGPSTILDFLLDTMRMEARLPDDKLARIATMIKQWLRKRNATKREILSLVGLRQHAAKVVRPGRTFVSRMYSLAANIQELDYFTRLNKEFRSDLYWWHIFLKGWNGVSFLQPADSAKVIIQTDASGSWGGAGLEGGFSCSGLESGCPSYNGKGACPNSHKLRYLGSNFVVQVCPV